MKKVFLCVIIAALFFSCSEEEYIPESIKVTADKTTALSDGKDAVRFTVTEIGGSDITKESEIRVNDKLIAGNTFTSSEAGIFKVTASYKGVIAQPVEIRFEEPVNPLLKIEASKSVLVADGADRITLLCKNNLETNNSVDVTGETLFLVNGKAIEGNVFKTKTAGVYKITALHKKEKSPEIEITAQTDFTATSKVYVELFAATWCPYCPAGMFFIEAAGKNSKIVPITVHPRNSASTTDPFFVPEGAPLYGFLGVTSVPTVVIDRNKTQLITGSGTILATNPADVVSKYQKPQTKVGIAIESKVEANNIEAKIYITATENMPTIKFVVMVTENKLIHDQKNNIKPELGNPIKDFEHNYVYRASYKDVFGEEISVTAKIPLEKAVTIPLKPEWKKENCDLIIIVTNSDNTVINAQKVKIGEQVGY